MCNKTNNTKTKQNKKIYAQNVCVRTCAHTHTNTH